MVREEVNTGGEKRFVYSHPGKVSRTIRPKENNYSLSILLRNILFRPLTNVKVELKKIDFDFFDTVIPSKDRISNLKSRTYHTKTFSQGYAKFDKISKGIYVAKFIKNNSIFERIIEIDSNIFKKIYAPVQFPFLKINKKINNEKMMILFDENRSDLNYCAFCNGKYAGFSDRFKCRYCGKYFCLDHHLPEDHKCKELKK